MLTRMHAMHEEIERAVEKAKKEAVAARLAYREAIERCKEARVFRDAAEARLAQAYIVRRVVKKEGEKHETD